MSTVIKLRRGTATEWSSNGSTVLASGEPGFELDTGRLKIGDGTTAWSGLAYGSIVPSGFVAGSGVSINLGSNGASATISVSGLDSSYISDFNEAVDDRIGNGLFAAGTGINLNYNDVANTFTISVTGVSFSGHTHISSDITDFSSSVSGLIPVKDILAGSGIGISSSSGNYTISVTGVTGGATITNYGDNRLLTSDGTSTGINGESNLTFDGSLLSVSGNLIANTGILDIIQFNTNNGSVNTQGQMGWNNTEGTVDIALADSTVMEIGQHRFFRARNTTGSPLYKGQVVYASGVHANGIITPNLYIANNTIDEIRFIGLIFDTINDNNNGYVIDFGHLRDLDLDGSATNYAVGDESWLDGDILYAHPTVAGKLTKVKPKHAISLAIILDNGGANGQLFVRPTNFGDLSYNHDVNISGVTNGQFLQYDSATDYWIPSSSGNFTTLLVNGTGVSISGHTHTSSDITNFNASVSGLLPTISNSGDNRILTSTGTSTGVNAESNATFDGSLLSVTGSGFFSGGINIGGSATTGIITGLSTSATVPSIRFQSITANHTNTSHTIFDFYKNISTRVLYIDGAGSTTIDSSNGLLVVPSTGPSAGNGALVAHGMRRATTTAGMDFAWGESITSATEPGIDLFPIGGTHIASGILLRLSKNSTKTDVAMLVNGSGNVGIGTTTPTAKLQVVGQGVFNSGLVTTTGNFTTSITSSLLNIDNLSLDSNTISSTNSNGNILLTPNGSGKVGIGSITPAYNLEVDGTINATQNIYVNEYPVSVEFPPVSGSIVSSAIDTDASITKILDVILTGNITLNNPTNSYNGATIRWRIQQDGTGGRTVTLDSKFQIPSSASNPLPWSTGANVMDTLAATYHAGRDKWDIVAFVPGY